LKYDICHWKMVVCPDNDYLSASAHAFSCIPIKSLHLGLMKT